jgi:hypothetical protein
MAAAALGMAGCLAFLEVRTDLQWPAAPYPAAALFAAGICFAGAISVKPFLGVALVLAMAVVAWDTHRSDSGRRWICKPMLGKLLLLGGVSALVVVAWPLHTWSLIGRAWDPNGIVIVSDARDWEWQTGYAAARIPTPGDIAKIPLLPFIAAFAGAHEPYGGRVDPLLVLAPLAILLRTGIFKPWHWKVIGRLIFFAAGYFLILAPMLVKTRFHSFSLACMAALGAVGYTAMKNRAGGNLSLWLAAFYLLALFGMADSVHDLLHSHPWEKPASLGAQAGTGVEAVGEDRIGGAQNHVFVDVIGGIVAVGKWGGFPFSGS